MKTVKTIKEYQDCINEVLRTKQPMKIKVEMSKEEIEKGATELEMEGVDTITGEEYDEIIPLD